MNMMKTRISQTSLLMNYGDIEVFGANKIVAQQVIKNECNWKKLSRYILYETPMFQGK